MRKAKKHVIIGNSAAGLSAVKAIRKMGDHGPIVLISAEDCNAYSPVLTTYYIAGQISRTNLFFVDDNFYKELNVQRIFGRRAVNIEPEKHIVHLDDHSKITYDNLLIASGASAKPLNILDPEASRYVTTLRTISDADKIIKAVKAAKEIVFLGAGLVSLQTIKAILGRSLKITLVVGSHQILSQQMDSESAAIIQNRLEDEGISILFGRGVDRVIRKGDGACVITSFSESLSADLVVVGKGIQPNISMVENTEIKMETGILVDDQMRTNLEDIYAAGDVAQGRNAISGYSEVIATWSNACAQGEIAGLNMAGYSSKRLGQFRENVTTLLGVSAVSIGISRPREGEFKEISYIDKKASVYRKFFLDGSRMVGAILLGRTEDAGVVRHCIASNLDISSWEEMIAITPLDFGMMLLSRDFSIPLFEH